MDISEFLASMQTNAGDRALARNVTMPAIPDADGDPQTKDASMPDPNTVEDQFAQQDEGYDQSQQQEVQDDDMQQFADGGEVGDEEDFAPADDTAPPAIPDDQAPGPESAGASSVREAGRAVDDWKSAAQAGIKKAIDWGYNTVHGANRGVSEGEQDPEHEGSVKAMLSGHGALSPQQWDQALQGVDPEGSLDDATKQLKAIGELDKFYGEQGAPAVWSALQHQRRQFNAYAAHATVAADNGNAEAAAKSAEKAFNKVPDGILTKITSAVGGYVAGKFNDARTARQDRENQSGGIADQASEGLGTPDGGVTAPDGKTRITKGAGSKYHIEQIEPESRKVVLSADLTAEQLKHALAEGFDKMVHRGTVAQTQEASDTHENHNHFAGPDWYSKNRPGLYDEDNAAQGGGAAPQGGAPRQPRDMGAANGLPPGTNVDGLSVGEISNLRRQYAQQGVREAGPNARAAATNQSRENIAAGNNQSRETNTRVQQEGLNKRLGNAPGQVQQNLRSAASKAQADAKNETFKTPEERDAFIQKRTQFWQNQMRAPGQQQPDGGGQQPQGGPAPPAKGAVVKGYTYMGGDPKSPQSWKKAQ